MQYDLMGISLFNGEKNPTKNNAFTSGTIKSSNESDPMSDSVVQA